MKRYALEPEVAGELGPRTEMDSSTHPPVVSRLHYEIHGWLGDELLESFPCFIVSKQLADLMEHRRLSGVRLGEVEVTVSEEAQELADEPLDLPEFAWLRPTSNLDEDVAVDGDGMLIVSQRALEVIQQARIDNCDIDEYSA